MKPIYTFPKNCRLGCFLPDFLRKILCFSFFTVLFLPQIATAQFPPACDADKSCIGKALSLTVSTGKGAHYADIDKTKSQDSLTTKLTFEAWMKPTQQVGMRQFVAGLWGPDKDVNDVWVIYFDTNNDLVFEVNHDTTKGGSTDNTIVRFPAATLYGAWNHIAAEFDGSTQTAKIILNGVDVASGRNAIYPAYNLRIPEKASLPMQIGSCNGVSDNLGTYRTFKGQMDEIRIWNRIVPTAELLCQKDKSRNGNESGLLIYYRCNDNAFTLCDATGKNNTGQVRSGANCQVSDRKFAQTVFITVPPNFNNDVYCDSNFTYLVYIKDTSACGNTVSIRIDNRDAAAFSLNKTTLNLAPNVLDSFLITYRGSIVGSILAHVKVRSTNSCFLEIDSTINFTRYTEFQYKFTRVNFKDTLFGGCIDITYKDTLLQICNKTDKLGNSKAITVTGFQIDLGKAFKVMTPTPFTIQPGGCQDIQIRFFVSDTTFTFNDSLRVLSPDYFCPGKVVIPLKGTMTRSFSILKLDGKSRIDSMNFGTTCVGITANSSAFLWKNFAPRDVIIDSIIIPKHFIGVGLPSLPATVPANGVATFQKFFNFLPTAPGVFRDSIIFKGRINGCPILRIIYVSGRGRSSQVQFQVRSITFANIIVGQKATMNITVTNNSVDTLSISFYLNSGEVFFLTGAKGAVLLPNQTRTIPITFQPFKDTIFRDEIHLFEQNCYTNDSIPVSGRGIIQTFQYEPEVMKIENVIGCQERLDTLSIRNIVGTPQTLTNLTLIDVSGRFSLFSPSAFPASRILQPSDTAMFIFRYKPNNSTQDFADKANLQYTDANNITWQAFLFGSSVSPKLFVTPLTTFGVLEVGDKVTNVITIENISFVTIKIDSSKILMPIGYRINKFLKFPADSILISRDSVAIEVEFMPPFPGIFNSSITISTDYPCAGVKASGAVQGKGVIIKLDAPQSIVNFGFVRPCDCLTREILLQNPSLVNNMTIDSLTFTGKNPAFFTWKSVLSQIIPYQIPPQVRDTLRVTYCPRSPAEDIYIDNSALFHIFAHGVGWTTNDKDSASYQIFLAGKRMLTFKPTPTLDGFPPTRVDTLSAPLFNNVTVPGIAQNPEREPIQVDSVTFNPDDRVFFASDNQKRAFPILLPADSTLKIRVDFKPRAPRSYQARMVIHISKPCLDADTTILVKGNGFAPAFGLQFKFNNLKPTIDTFRTVSCDTLVIPCYSSRQIPASSVDISFRLGYDTTILRYVGATSPYTIPQAVPDPINGTRFLLKNCRNVDSLQPFMFAKFLSRTNSRADLLMSLDSINFDTQDVIFFQIIAANDKSRILIQKAELKTQNNIQFDSVRVLDCVQRTFNIKNTGDVAITVDSLLPLPKDVKLVGTTPKMTDLIPPNGEILITLEFCPSQMKILDSSATALSTFPCGLSDSSKLAGFGYAPDFPVRFGLAQDFTTQPTFQGKLGDSVKIPLFAEKDFSADYHNTIYWLKKLNFDTRIQYNPFMLKFISVKSLIDSTMTSNALNGDISLHFRGLDSLKAGAIAEFYFVITVPDSISSSLMVSASKFSADSLMFLNILPAKTTSTFFTNGKCTVTFLQYSASSGQLYQNVPNPFGETTTIEFDTQETAPIFLKIYSINGELVKTLFDGSEIRKGGHFSVEINASDLTAGMYYYILQSGTFMDRKPMILVK